MWYQNSESNLKTKCKMNMKAISNITRQSVLFKWISHVKVCC